nr:uncharacterized protein LOC123002454 [Drosophila takahashii]
MATAILETLKRQRSNIKRNITRIRGMVDAKEEEEQKSPAELKCRLGILESYFKQALSVQSEIETMESTDSGRADLEDSYITTKLAIQQLLGEDLHNIVFDHISAPSYSAPSRLPRLALPSFDGNHKDYKNFISSFLQLGPALEAVAAFPVTGENYAKALERLKDRYDKPALIFVETIASIFILPPAAAASAQQLRNLIDNASALYSALSSLGSDAQISEAMLIYVVMEKCDQQTKTKWNESLDYLTLPSWSQCTQILERHCQFLLSDEQSHGSERPRPTRPPARSHNSSFSLTNAPCVYCLAPSHKLLGCDKFKDLNPTARFDVVKTHRLCLNCLCRGHQLSSCPSRNRCRTCNKAHHTLLHNNHSLDSSRSHQPYPTAPPLEAATHSHSHSGQKSQVMLATAMVLVKDALGTYWPGRALLASCSQVNFVTEDFAQRLRLRRERHAVQIRSIGHSQTDIKYCTTASVKSRISSFVLSADLCIIPQISYQPDPAIDVSTWKLPENTPLADERFYQSRHVNLLLGTEAFFDALTVGQIRLVPQGPLLQKTQFGWVVTGRLQQTAPIEVSTCMALNASSIDVNLKRLWELEAVDSPPLQKPEHAICEEQYEKTTCLDSTGRIVVKLPFKADPTRLGDSFDIARRRFLSMERRLSKSPALRQQYCDFMEEYEKLGHMSPVIHPKLHEPHYYIPNHCVLKPSSESTKLRVVFDASCRTSNQLSLNDLLCVGPTLQEDLYLQLLKFRLHRYAITADVTKMYRQVNLDIIDRKYQYILWRAFSEDTLRTYQLNTVTYGTADAPFLATRSLNHLADVHQADCPIGVAIIKSSFYVDDLLTGADDLETLRIIKDQVTEILRRGHFPLTKWHSNYVGFMEDHASKKLSSCGEGLASALGVNWNQHKDTLFFKFIPRNHATRITKRSILSTASALFDPLGLLSPLVVVAKILLQELWLAGLQWDESVPENIHTAWSKCLESFQTVSILSIPRYCLQHKMRSLQLHGFCDASIRAYGCCVYLRSETSTGDVAVQLLTGKSRVAPVKKKSLPKLELCGAHLLGQLHAKLKPLLADRKVSVYFWTDSQIVFHWLKQHSVTLSAFVGNRISEIQEWTADGQWKFVPGESNPADTVSRGAATTEMAASMWFTGPQFLTQPSSQWPITPQIIDIDPTIVKAEQRRSTFTTAVISNHVLQQLTHISSYNRCIRTIAYVFRFANLSRGVKIVNPSLTSEELRRALFSIVYNIQQHSSGHALIRVGGRLQNADIPESERHPLLLPSKSHFAWIYVRHLHLRNCHAGPKALVALIRLEYWIINARDLARRVVRSCIACVRFRPKLENQLMGSLPLERVLPQQPFQRCGVDFCGPFNIYLRIRGKVPTKSYLAVFICLASKAVHIEVVSDLSTKAFLAALKRMIARRSIPTDIFCDNGTNFVGAANHLQELRAFLQDKATQEVISSYLSTDFITFHFIPPRAAHFGGLWEAAVKSAKSLLYRTLMNSRFTFEELCTITTEVEAILNSRPLSPLSPDPNDFGALTPGHFLVGKSLRAPPERTVSSTHASSLERFDAVTASKQQFWRRWSLEYLHELRSRTKWTTPSANIRANTMVIIHDDNLPPQRWKIGRVETVVPGKDGLVRVAHIRTSTGVCCRLVHKLAVLPTDSQSC